MKTISIFLALINSLAAGLVISASLPAIQILRPTTSLWNATKVMAGVGIIVVGVLTWIHACRFGTSLHLIVLAGLFLVVLGTASAMWTIHLGLVSGKLKDVMFLYSGSLMIQGGMSIWNLFVPEDKSTTQHNI